MAKQKAPDSALVTAASAIEEGLAKWETVAADAIKLETSSEKSLGRAKKLLEECADCEKEMAKQIHAFVTAMQAVQDRQRVCMERTLEVAQKIQHRITSRQALLDRFGALGQRAGEINEPVSKVMELIGNKASPEELLVPLNAVEETTKEVAGEAESLAKDARESKWDDIAREADTLRQQIHSVNKKIHDAHQSVAKRSPS